MSNILRNLLFRRVQEQSNFTKHDDNCNGCVSQGDDKLHIPCNTCNDYAKYKAVYDDADDSIHCGNCAYDERDVNYEPCSSCVDYSNFTKEDIIMCSTCIFYGNDEESMPCVDCLENSDKPDWTPES